MKKPILPLQDFWKINWKTRLILGFLTSSAIMTLPVFGVEITEDIVKLPEDPIDFSPLIDIGCGDFSKDSEFINSGRGGLPPIPDDFTSGDAVWNDTRQEKAILTSQEIPSSTIEKPAKSELVAIIPATGWIFNDKGDVTLVSHGSKVNYSSFNSNSSNCRVR